MWTTRSERVLDGWGIRSFVYRDDNSATFAEVISAWQDDAAFRSWFNDSLADAPFSAFRWETPAVTRETLSRPFEFVLIDSPELSQQPDPDAFAEHFHDSPAASVVAFPNLRGDAVLVVPRPIAMPDTYTHLAAFVRNAPESQRDTLWQCVGKAMWERIGPRPVWLSTAGAGVSWLHIRLDDRPKYYSFALYR